MNEHVFSNVRSNEFLQDDLNTLLYYTHDTHREVFGKNGVAILAKIRLILIVISRPEPQIRYGGIQP